MLVALWTWYKWVKSIVILSWGDLFRFISSSIFENPTLIMKELIFSITDFFGITVSITIEVLITDTIEWFDWEEESILINIDSEKEVIIKELKLENFSMSIWLL